LAIIDDFMRTVAHQDPEERTDENGWRHLTLGSARGIAGIAESEDELFLHAEAEVMPLPSDRDLLQALMREALETNCKLTGASTIAIRGKALVVAGTENMRKLRETEEFGNLISFVMSFANAIDDDWKQKYGGTTRTRERAPLAQAV
jgi:hypothetical protein